MPGLLDTVKGWFGGGGISEEERALVDAVVQNPDDDAPRLAYADWLSQRGDPRGEFIRVDCELSALAKDDPRRAELDRRYGELMGKHGKRWVKPLKELELQPISFNTFIPALWFERGMIERVTIDKRGVIPGKVERLFELAPLLRYVTFERCSPDWHAVADCPQLARLRGLDVSADLKMSEADLRRLLASPHLAGLTELDLGSKDFGGAVVEALEQSSLRGLKKLRLGSCRLEVGDVERLAAWPGLAQLEDLDLRYNTPGRAGLAALVTSPHLKNLEALDLYQCELHPEGVAPLADAQLPKLKRLGLESNYIEPAGLQALLASPVLAQLTELELGYNDLGDEGIGQLAAAEQIGGLIALDVASNEIGPAGASALFGSPHLGRLVELKVSHNPFGDEGVQAMIGCEKLAGLMDLEAYSLECSTDLEQKLADHFGEEVVSV